MIISYLYIKGQKPILCIILLYNDFNIWDEMVAVSENLK